MTVDFHTHTFPARIAASAIAGLREKSGTENFLDGTEAALSASCHAAGVDLAVILPVVTNPQSAEKINLHASELNSHTAETRLLSFGGIHPDTPDCKGVIARAAALGLKGIKLHPPYQGVPFDDIRYKNILYEAESHGLVTLFHAGIDIGIPGQFCTPAMILSVMREVAPVRLVAAHMGGWAMWGEAMSLLAGDPACAALYLDTAFSFGALPYRPEVPAGKRLSLLTEEAFVSFIRAKGSEKVLFGTDSPWAGQKQQLALFDRLPLTAEEKKAVLGENAARLLSSVPSPVR